MYRSVLVPLDGSAFGEHALPLALSIARRAGASLHLVRVHVPLVPHDEGFFALGPEVDANARENERAYLKTLAERIGKVGIVSVTTALLDGSIADALCEYAVAQGIDLAVLTTHGRGALARFWLGSVADELLRRLPIPILLVRPQEALPDLSGEQELQHVLIPLDGSELAEQVLEPALALGTLSEADFTLLRVIAPVWPTNFPPPTGTGVSGLDQSMVRQLQELQGQWHREAQTYLDVVAERLRARSLRVQTQVVAHGQPAVAILDEARAQGFDVIALATHGRRGLPRLFLGSVADKVVRGATTPVLVVRPRGK